ncbi:MYCBP-associated protein family-domain-containing protein [Gaertneriomyces semiglobifer]|nr:MYCBP-associated protein family-domain-containing protein [Gaertneriomyces semiglobifer]
MPAPVNAVRKHGKPYMLVAKPVPPDLMGEDPQYAKSAQKPVPVSLVATKERGPSRAGRGKIVAHTILGDAEEFEQMERLYGDGTQEEENLDENEEAHVVAEKEAESTKQLKALEESQRRQEEERKVWLGQLHIFQRYKEVREEHALKNWQRHSVQWSKVEQKLAKRSSKPADELLMCRLSEYRSRIEEKELVETALRLLEEEHINFWKTGIKLGSDLLGLTMPVPKGGPRPLERLKTYEKVDKHRRSVFQDQKERELMDIVMRIDPFAKHGDSGYLNVEGKPILQPQMQHLAEAYVQRLGWKSSGGQRSTLHEERELADIETEPATAENDGGDGSEDLPPRLQLSTSLLTFTTTLHEVSTSVVTLYNTSKTAIRFDWKPVAKLNKLGTTAVRDGRQRFYFYHKKGIVMPGNAFDIIVIFKSDMPGVFTESWSFESVPKCDTERTITLQGTAIEPDTFAPKRAALERMLLRKQAETAAKQTIEAVLRNIDKYERIAKCPIAEQEEVEFVRKNRPLGLFYTTKAYTSFSQLYTATLAELHDAPYPKQWDNSINTLHIIVNSIPSPDIRSTYLRQLNDLVKSASEPPQTSITKLLHVIAYDGLTNLADTIADASENMRKAGGLPIQRSAVMFFGNEEVAEDLTQERKPTPPVSTPEVKGAKGIPPSAPAKKPGTAPAKAPPPKAAAKGKPIEPVPEPEKKQQLSLARVVRRQPKPDSAQFWSHERRLGEQRYKEEFSPTVSLNRI